MPLSDIQGQVLRTLAAHRNPNSYVAGSTPLHRDGPRYSSDIDIFHNDEDGVTAASEHDIGVLRSAGFAVEIIRQRMGITSVSVRRGGEETKLEWVRESDFRFYPAIPDTLFGYRLHLVDIATNKALAAAGRQAPRDALDLVYIHERHLPLGAVIWAAVAKDPGFSPEALIAEIRRNSRYQPDEYEALSMTEPVDARDVSRRLRSALEQADSFIRSMQAGQEGLVFLDAGGAVQPDVSRLGSYETLEGRRQGVWPGSSEIGGSMLGR